LLSDAFKKVIGNEEVRKRVGNSAGANFGTTHFGQGFQTIVLGAGFPKNLEEEAQNLVIFDLFIQNPDRTAEKPNMLSDGKHLVAYDHELAFSFSDVLFGPINLWELPESDRLWIRNLVLLPLVKGSAVNYDSFAERMSRLDTHFWDRALFLTPEAWRHESFEVIRRHIQNFIASGEVLFQELKSILS
jgi:hypothetical protein